MRTRTPLTTRDAIDVMSEEYRTLREESLAGISARHQIVTVALGALSVIIAGLVAEKAHALVVFLTAYILVPWLCKAFLLMWLGEYGRSVRAGGALRSLERRINGTAGRDLLTWENKLSASKSHMSVPYSAVILVFALSSQLSALIGITFACIYAATHPVVMLQLGDTQYLEWNLEPFEAAAFTAIALLLVAGLLEFFFSRKVQRMREELQKGMAA
jgi:hypothetical protein